MRRISSAVCIASVLAVGALQGCATVQQESFGSPEAAADALIAALSQSDDNALGSVFGPDYKELASSGDPVADREAADNFLSLYEERHELVDNENGDKTLLLGPESWPFPIPLIGDGGSWRFDTDAGLDEILNRRIGHNELDTISTCLAYVDAQLEYAIYDPDGDGLRDYAGQFVSDPGEKNGLYWPTDINEPLSPLGAVAVAATEAGYVLDPSGGPRPFNGYLFKILRAQGPSARDGARDFMVDGNMMGGFGLVARPAKYGNSGIMTFIVNQDGIVYERDFGPRTESLAKAIDSYDPDESWMRVNDEPYVTPE